MGNRLMRYIENRCMEYLEEKGFKEYWWEINIFNRCLGFGLIVYRNRIGFEIYFDGKVLSI